MLLETLILILIMLILISVDAVGHFLCATSGCVISNNRKSTDIIQRPFLFQSPLAPWRPDLSTSVLMPSHCGLVILRKYEKLNFMYRIFLFHFADYSLVILLTVTTFCWKQRCVRASSPGLLIALSSTHSRSWRCPASLP